MSNNHKECDAIHSAPDDDSNALMLPRKRQKTNIMEGFRSISLSRDFLNNTGTTRNYLPVDTALPQQTPRDQPSRSQESVEFMCDDADDDDENNSSIVIEALDEEESSSDDASEMLDLLSDKEVAEREVMYELALGKSSKTSYPRKHPVDAKVEEWMRRDLWRRWLQKESGGNEVRAIDTEKTVDDIQIDDEVYDFEAQENHGESFESNMLKKSNSSLSSMEAEMDMTP